MRIVNQDGFQAVSGLLESTFRFPLHAVSVSATPAVRGMFISRVADARGGVITVQNSFASTLRPVVLCGWRLARATMQTLKRESASIVDSVLADEKGKRPDAGVVAARQRVTRVQTLRDRGQFTRLTIGGLSQTETRPSGREALSAFMARTPDSSLLPSEFVAGLTICKPASAEVVEGGPGGVIDARKNDRRVASGVPQWRPWASTALYAEGHYRELFTRRDSYQIDVGAVSTYLLGGVSLFKGSEGLARIAWTNAPMSVLTFARDPAESTLQGAKGVGAKARSTSRVTCATPAASSSSVRP